MRQSKRLLIITNRYPRCPDDTASPFVYDFRQALERLGIDVQIVTPFYAPPTEDTSYIDNSVCIFEWSDGRHVISQLPLYRPSSLAKIRIFFRNGFRSAAGILESGEFDGILALWAAPSGYIALKLSRKYDLPYAVWALGSDINSWAKLPFIGSVIVKVLKSADRLFADGCELAMKVQAITDRNCRFIPSYHAIRIDTERPLNPEKRFVSFGRIEKNKGVFDLLEAFRIFLNDHPDWKLYYVGTGRDENKLTSLIQAGNLSDSVVYAGYLHRSILNKLLAGSTAAVIPSYSDSLPLTFGEAMQARLPVICSDVGDMPYFIDKHKVGLHYPVGNVDELAERLHLMTRQHHQFSVNCPAVLEELDIDNSAQAVAEWLDAVTFARKNGERAYANR
ncbi:MAG: glycosyltransferase [Candidatus Zixiibacteriota bacterium]|nr:MAG: glycosyltransferase [candidate division Zixibacteria bacterium]